MKKSHLYFTVISLIPALITLPSLSAAAEPFNNLQAPLYYQSFYNTTKTPPKMVTPQGKWLKVNLDTKTLSIMMSTSTVQTFPILAVGKPKSESQTLGGTYRAPYKSLLHKSKIAPVNLPYAIQIFGNYFIHGVPLDMKGNPQYAEYSAGCIRLNTDDAKTVYEFTDKLTPIIIEGSIQRGTNFFLHEYTNASVSAPEFSVYDITNSADVYTRGFDKATTSAYITRMIPALVSFDVHNQEALVRNPDTGKRIPHLELLDSFVKTGDLTMFNALIKPHTKAEFTNLVQRKMRGLALASSTLATGGTYSIKSPIGDEMKVLAYIASFKPYLITGDLLDPDGDSHIIREVKTKNGTTTLGIVLRRSQKPAEDIKFIVNDIAGQ